MALQNHPALYTGGAERFNSQPHVALYANLMARKQARDDAFDEYIRSLNKNVNAAGMRNQDRPVFDEKLAEWQKFGMENRDAIRRRQGGADMEFQRKYQDILNLVQESKTEEEKKKPVVELLLDPNKRDRLNNDEFVGSIQAHDEPLYTKGKAGWERNPNRKTFDFGSIEFNPKPFEQDKYFKQFEDVKRQDLAPTIVPDRKTMTQTVTTTSVFDKEAKDVIANRAVTDYAQNPSFKEVVDKLDPKQYNDFYKQNFGHDIETPADLAVAYTLKGLQQKTVSQKIEPDWVGRDEKNFEQQKALQRMRNANAREMLYLRDSLKEDDVAGQDLWIDEYLNKVVDEAAKNPIKKIVRVGENRMREDGIYLDPTLSKALEKDGQSPEYVTVTKDGKIRPVYLKYAKDKDGNVVPSRNESGEFIWDETLSVPISQEQVKLALGKRAAGVKQINIEMTNNAKPASTRTQKSSTIKVSKPKAEFDDF